MALFSHSRLQLIISPACLWIRHFTVTAATAVVKTSVHVINSELKHSLTKTRLQLNKENLLKLKTVTKCFIFICDHDRRERRAPQSSKMAAASVLTRPMSKRTIKRMEILLPTMRQKPVYQDAS